MLRLHRCKGQRRRPIAHRLLIYFAFALTVLVHSAKAASKPNIILYYTDDLGIGEVNQQAPEWAVYDDIPYDSTIESDKVIHTPSLERLAKEGVRMMHSYSSSPLCGPARYALLTGIPTGRSPVRGNNLVPTTEYPLSEDQPNLARLLQNQGYKTMMVGKWGLGYQGTTGAPWLQGIDSFYGYLTHAEAHRVFPAYLWESSGTSYSKVTFSDNSKASDDRCVCTMNTTDCALDENTGLYQNSNKCTNANMLFRNKAVTYIEDHLSSSPDVPFFLYYACIAPHNGYFSPTTQKYRDLTSPVSTYGRYTDLLESMPSGEVGHIAALTHEMDASVGVLLDLLEEHNIRDDTIFIFTSDNGPHITLAGDDDYSTETFRSTMLLRGYKRKILEGGVREPTIISWPGKLDAGTTSHIPHVHYDFLLTIAGLIGMDSSSSELDAFRDTGAKSFHEELLAQDDGEGFRDWMSTEICSSNRVNATEGCDFSFFDLRDEDKMLKLVRQEYTYYLYDIFKDPYELSDLSSTEPDTYASTMEYFENGHFRTNYCIYSERECELLTPAPTSSPTTPMPTETPTKDPTSAPTERPTPIPTDPPTPNPTRAPTNRPSKTPTKQPTSKPTKTPTKQPTSKPTPKPIESGNKPGDAAISDRNDLVQYAYLENAKCSASVAGTSTQEDPSDCLNACSKLKNCRWFDFDTSDGTCNLYTSKSCSSSYKTSQDTDLYEMDTVMQTFESTGSRCTRNYKRITIKRKLSRERCAYACAMHSKCNNFDYIDASSSQCLLFRACKSIAASGVESYTMPIA